MVCRAWRHANFKRMRRGSRLMAIGLLAPLLPWARNLEEIEKKVNEFTLANGMHFIVVERRGAPLVSFHTFVNAGPVDDRADEPGIARMFERLAYKGTQQIGTRNWVEEKKALDAMERAYDRLEAEKRKGARASAGHLEALGAAMRESAARASAYADSNAFPAVFEENAGADLNAMSSADSTNYFVSLPSHRAELWFLMESQRLLRPVFRDFYIERSRVIEERRQSSESGARGKLLEMLLTTAFAAHPYRNAAGGWRAGLESLRPADAESFFQRHFAPGNITAAIAGDISQAEAKRLARKYFSALPPRPAAPPRHVPEVPQEGAKRVEVASSGQPWVFAAYKRPDQYHKDDLVFDILGVVLSSGRSGWLYRDLVAGENVAAMAYAAPSIPGGRFPSLFLVSVLTANGHSVQDVERALDVTLDRLKKEKIGPETLARARTRTRATVIQQLESNAGIAQALAFYHANYGNWRKLATVLDDIDKVTEDDVRRVAAEYFVPHGRTVAVNIGPRDGGGQ
ncbi:MAG: insulinase family protein [Bryobacterales bacterium]|nr:insulinase family protein [Bryobacterales bacterium]